MERKAFSPGGPDFITTATNRIASGQLRSALLDALTGDAAVRFDNRDNLLGKGFEMITILREAYAPTGELALMANFSTLTNLKMGADEVLSTYISRVLDTIVLLRGGAVVLHPALVNLFAVHGLNNNYAAVKMDIAVHPQRFVSLDLDELERTCNTYTRTLQAVTSDAVIPSAAAATPAPPPPPAPDQTPTPTYPPKAHHPLGRLKAVLRAAKTTCPVCFHPHPFTQCFVCLGAGYVTEHDPEKAKEQLKAQGKPPRRKPAAAASATSVHQTPACPPPPPPSDDDKDASAIAASAFHITDYDSLSDDEGGLLDHGAIPACAGAAAEWTTVGDGRRARPTSVPPRPIDPGISPAPGK